MAALEILLSKSMRGDVPQTHVDIVHMRVFGRAPTSQREASRVSAALAGRRVAEVIGDGIVVWRDS